MGHWQRTSSQQYNKSSNSDKCITLEIWDMLKLQIGVNQSESQTAAPPTILEVIADFVVI